MYFFEHCIIFLQYCTFVASRVSFFNKPVNKPVSVYILTFLAEQVLAAHAKHAKLTLAKLQERSRIGKKHSSRTLDLCSPSLNNNDRTFMLWDRLRSASARPLLSASVLAHFLTSSARRRNSLSSAFFRGGVVHCLNIVFLIQYPLLFATAKPHCLSK